MALCKLERRNYGGKWPMSIKYQNLHSFKEGLILQCQSILETRRITHLNGSAHFTIPLGSFILMRWVGLKRFLLRLWRLRSNFIDIKTNKENVTALLYYFFTYISTAPYIMRKFGKKEERFESKFQFQELGI